MKLNNGANLAYCTNVHRGNSWEETFDSLEKYVLQVKQKVCPDQPFAIGLRLGAEAARKLSDPREIYQFRKWLDDKGCYVFTINGFPYGSFHGTRVKEKVYQPDWGTKERLDYTVTLFEILAQIIEPNSEGSVSTLPGSFKEFHPNADIPSEILENLLVCAEKMEAIAKPKNLDLHLGLEPEPLGSFETTPETIVFFDRLFQMSQNSNELSQRIGVNYDCCHLAIENEKADEGLSSIKQNGIRLSKIHLSSALSVKPTQETLSTLESFVEEVYLHQVIVIKNEEVVCRIKDLDEALLRAKEPGFERGDEWRIHFHAPLHSSPSELLQDTKFQVFETMDWLAQNESVCNHLEMETYTWEVLPPHLRDDSVIDQVAKEYKWTLDQFAARGINRVDHGIA